MDLETAKAYVLRKNIPHGRLGLDGLKLVLKKLGNPQKNQKIIHIAGTNGKGSTAAYIANIFAQAGFKVGQYASPYVYNFGERMRILDGSKKDKAYVKNFRDGQISPDLFFKYTNEIAAVIASMDLETKKLPNYFEILTIMAFLYFAEAKCDLWVLEVGLGGRLDPTNVIDAPEIAVVTSIGLDHQDRLGDTRVKIAGEKAGILKKGTKYLALYDQSVAIEDPEEAKAVTKVFLDKAKALGIKVIALKSEDITRHAYNLKGQSFAYKDYPKPFKTKLLANYASLNACLAIEAARAFAPDLKLEDIYQGIENTYWPGRLELLNEDPVILLDGSHNPQGVRSLRHSLEKLFPQDTTEIHLTMSMKSKDHVENFKQIFQDAKIKYIICTGIKEMSKVMPAEELAKIAKQVAKEYYDKADMPIIYSIDSIEAASEKALELLDKEDKSILIAWGSFYMAPDFKNTVEKYLNK